MNNKNFSISILIYKNEQKKWDIKFFYINFKNNIGRI